MYEGAYTGSGGGGRDGTVAMERNVARLFQDRAAAFGEVDFTQASILGGAHSTLCKDRAGAAGSRPGDAGAPHALEQRPYLRE